MRSQASSLPMARHRLLAARPALYRCIQRVANILLAVLAIAGVVMSVAPPAALASTSGFDVCIEDGGQAECTSPQIVDQSGEYTLWTILPPSDGGNKPTFDLNSDQDISNAISSQSPGCDTYQNPIPPYDWTVQLYTGNGYEVYTTPNISATQYYQSNCTQPTPRTYYGQRNRPLSCPPAWINSLSTPTTNYPEGFCWRPAVGQPNETVGEPIDPALGNEMDQEVDYSGGTASPLRFIRTYNYAGAIVGPGNALGAVGQGWTHSYESRLWFYAGGAIRALRPDGDHRVFTLVNGQYQEFGTAVDQLLALQSGGTTSGWELIDANDTEEFYDTSGNLLSISYRGGASVSMTYSTSATPATIAPYPGLLITVSDNFGHQLNFTYNGYGQIATMTDPGGAVYTYSYSPSYFASQWLINSVEYPDTSSRQYVYNEAANTGNTNTPYALTGIIDENGSRYATIGYSSGQAYTSQLAGGVDQYSIGEYLISGYAYGGEYDGEIVTDPLGTQRRYRYQEQSNGVTKLLLISPGCPECSDPGADFSYDANGNIATEYDNKGNETVYSYDLTRNLETSRTEAYGTAQARTITTQWDPNWRQPDLVTESNHTTGYTYDSMGNVLTKTITDTVANTARAWIYTYDGYGRVLTAQDPRGNVEAYTYYTCTTGYECGELNTATDALGHVTTYNTYDANGRPLTITDPNETVMTLAYDARGRLTSQTVGGQTTSFSYYPTGLLEQITLPDGSELLYTYDAAHRLTQVSDGLGNKVVYTLDVMGNRTAENSYDPSGTLHRTHTRVINTMDEVYQEVNAADTSAVTTTYGYDGDGNPTSIDAPLSRNAAESYDALNRVSSITDPGSGHTSFGYDAEDDLTSVTDPRNLTISYSYDGFADITFQVSPDTGTTSNSYDSAGNLATSTDARGAVATYGYDAVNRATSIAYSLNGSTDQTLLFTYDQGTNGIGHLTGASDANHSMSFSYDALGEMTGMSQSVAGVTRSISYGYTNGDLTSITTPSGQTVTYGYNADHQVTSLAVNGTTVLANVGYEPFGPVDGWTWGNGAAFSRSFSGDGLITGIGNPGSQESLSYDDASRISGITNTASGSSSWTYSYDRLDRLTGATSSSVTENWTYDANGNRLTETGTAPSTYSISSKSNEINGITGTLTRTYAYDAAGNTLSDSADTDSYDDAGRLKKVTNTVGTTTFVYNAAGQMIESSGPSGTNLYVYDQAGRLLGEYNSSGNLIQETVWLGDMPVATIQPSGSSVTVYYVEPDQLDTPRAVVRPSDNTQMWTWYSGAFGAEAPNTNPQGAGTFTYDLRFPGQVAGAWGGTFQNDSRDYDSMIGRYIESDPIGLQGGINTYAYVGSDPVSLVDAQGRDAIQINYDYYEVNTGLGFHLPLGHGAVVAVDPATGHTEYYEFGRYTDKKCGNVRRKSVPNVVIGSDGKPTQQSLDALYAFIGKNYGENSHVSATYYDTTNYKDAIKYAQNFSKHHACYRLLGNNCKTFAHAAATVQASTQAQ